MISTDLHPREGEGETPRYPSFLPSSGEFRSLTTDELVLWLEEHREAVADRWLAEVRSRSEGMEGDELVLVGDFLRLLCSFLAPGLGVHRDAIERLFQEAATLYGNLGAYRRKAAGESVEEFQLLREVLLRNLYAHPPGESPSPFPGLRDLLQVNRLIDLGVTYASVGHADILFFNLIQEAGVDDSPASDLFEKVRDQIGGIRKELDALAMQAVGETTN